jgi:hypothetical protein
MSAALSQPDADRFSIFIDQVIDAPRFNISAFCAAAKISAADALAWFLRPEIASTLQSLLTFIQDSARIRHAVLETNAMGALGELIRTSDNQIEIRRAATTIINRHKSDLRPPRATDPSSDQCESPSLNFQISNLKSASAPSLNTPPSPPLHHATADLDIPLHRAATNLDTPPHRVAVEVDRRGSPRPQQGSGIPGTPTPTHQHPNGVQVPHPTTSTSPTHSASSPSQIPNLKSAPHPSASSPPAGRTKVARGADCPFPNGAVQPLEIASCSPSALCADESAHHLRATDPSSDQCESPSLNSQISNLKFASSPSLNSPHSPPLHHAAADLDIPLHRAAVEVDSRGASRPPTGKRHLRNTAPNPPHPSGVQVPHPTSSPTHSATTSSPAPLQGATSQHKIAPGGTASRLPPSINPHPSGLNTSSHSAPSTSLTSYTDHNLLRELMALAILLRKEPAPREPRSARSLLTRSGAPPPHHSHDHPYPPLCLPLMAAS